jgi:transcriptional regulator with XRE-family HTH domain
MPGSFGGRLRRAIKEAGLSIRRFQMAMEKEEVPGSSSPAVFRYLNDRTSPSVEWAAAAARLTNVRLAWLLAGEGAPSVRDLADVAHQDAPEWVPAAARGQFVALAIRFGSHLVDRSPTLVLDAMPRLNRMVRGMVTGLEKEFGAMPLRSKEAVVVLLCLAIDRAMPPSREDRLQTEAPTRAGRTQ